MEIVRAEVEAVLEESGALERRRRGWTGSGTGSLGTEREAERERVVLFLRGVEGDLKRLVLLSWFDRWLCWLMLIFL